MSEDWNAVAADVAAGLAEVGAAASLVVPGAVTGESYPGAGDGTQAADTLHTMTAVEVEFSRRELDGGSVQTGDVKIMSTVPAVSPDISKKLRWGGRDYQVMDFNRVAPNGADVVVYEWHLRP